MIFSRIAALSAGFLIPAALLTAQMHPPGDPANPSNFPDNGLPGVDGSMTGRAAPMNMSRGMLLTGKVMLDDGSAPSEPVKIERVCLGQPHAEGFTDSKGRFSLNVGRDLDAMADASESPSGSQMPGADPLGGPRDSRLQNCELRAVLAGFRSDTVSLANRRYMDDPDVGAIVLHRTENVPGLTISATSARAPKDARKAYEKGLEAEQKNKPDEAQKQFEKAVDLYPKYAAVWFALGQLYESRDHAGQALDAYQKSVAADADYVNPYVRICELEALSGKWQNVADSSDKVLHLNPFDFPRAYYLNAFANLQLKKLDQAEKSAREAMKLDTAHQNPRSWYVLGIILADKQDFRGAVEQLRLYLQFAPNEKGNDKIRQQLAEIEKQAQGKP